MDPAVQLGVWLELVEADDGLGVEVVFHSNEQKAQNYDKRCGLISNTNISMIKIFLNLMMQLEHRGVRNHPGVQEPPD